MRDLFTWSVPLGHLFGISLRVHWLFPAVILAVVLRVAFQVQHEGEPYLWLEALLVMVLLFVVVLLHELGHCYGAHLVDGDAQDILMWPLGGLASVEVPYTWRANLTVAVAGPVMNLLLALLAGSALVFCSFWPPLNPLWDPLRPVLYNAAKGADFGSKYGQGAPFTGYRLRDRWVSADDPELADALKANPAAPGSRGEPYQAVPLTAEQVEREKKADTGWVRKGDPPVRVEARPWLMTWWQVLLARFFWLNWVLALLNLVLVAFPMDGGRILQCLLWPRIGFRQATSTAIVAGIIWTFILAITAAAVNEIFPLCLAMFIFVTCWQQRIALETGGEESVFGYDFSQGYTSLERDQPARRRRPNVFQRWLQRRRQWKMQRAQEQREAEERRMDELLEKVQRAGLQSLSDEERRFLKRVSDRYRNRQ
jgi:Zn-dependent protease